MTPHIRKWLQAVAMLAGLGVLSGCNFFNPSGTGTYPSNDPDQLVDAGQRALNELRFSDAYGYFSKALLLDSTKSLAYHGLAKSELGKDGFSISKLVKLADTISNASDSA